MVVCLLRHNVCSVEWRQRRYEVNCWQRSFKTWFEDEYEDETFPCTLENCTDIIMRFASEWSSRYAHKLPGVLVARLLLHCWGKKCNAHAPLVSMASMVVAQAQQREIQRPHFFEGWSHCRHRIFGQQHRNQILSCVRFAEKTSPTSLAEVGVVYVHVSMKGMHTSPVRFLHRHVTLATPVLPALGTRRSKQHLKRGKIGAKLTWSITHCPACAAGCTSLRIETKHGCFSTPRTF